MDNKIVILNDTNEPEVKNKHKVHHSSDSQTWNTPKSLYDPLNNVWKFERDVACLKESALCSLFFTPDDNGLEQTWGHYTCWCNPPYDNIKGWAEKCYTSFTEGSTVVMLIPSRTDTIAFHSYIFGKATAICFIKGRLKFANPTENSTATNSAPFPSCLVVYDKDLTAEKKAVLESLGAVVYM